MNESLLKATHDLDYACGGLQQALKHASAVEGDCLLELIRRTSILGQDVKRLLQSHLEDTKGDHTS